MLGLGGGGVLTILKASQQPKVTLHAFVISEGFQMTFMQLMELCHETVFGLFAHTLFQPILV